MAKQDDLLKYEPDGERELTYEELKQKVSELELELDKERDAYSTLAKANEHQGQLLDQVRNENGVLGATILRMCVERYGN